MIDFRHQYFSILVSIHMT